MKGTAVSGPPRFSGNDKAYVAGLCFLFVGVALVYSFGMAFLVLGAVVIVVSIATSFFVTWLSVGKEVK